MRIRTIKPGFFANDQLAELPPLVRLLFIGLWCLADRRGRLEDRPKRIKAEVLPYDDFDVDAMLDRLSACGFLVRYSHQEVRLIQVRKFEEHQRITGKEAETESKFPPPEESDTGEALGKQQGNVRETTETTGREGKGKEGNRKGMERNGKEVVGAAPEAVEATQADFAAFAPAADPVVLTFPTAGAPNTWSLTQSFIDELSRLYPNVQVTAEADKALMKITRKIVPLKTAKGMPKFLTGWMDRTQNSARSTAGNQLRATKYAGTF
jgi:hypothetical protein